MKTLRQHLPEYLIEAFGLCVILIGASMTGTVLESVEWPVKDVVSDPMLRRAIAGASLGISVLLLVLSPWGRRSGAHFNPGITLVFLRLGRMNTVDAVFYILFQAAGGLSGVLLAHALMGDAFALPPVSFLATMPGRAGISVAFAAEVCIAFVLMAGVLWSGRTPHMSRMTGPLVALLLAVFVLVESPLSGTSLNPARSLASALPSGIWKAFWIYLVAPPLGMLTAAEVFVRTRGIEAVGCARLSLHHQQISCILCGYLPHAEPSARNLGGPP